MKYNEFIFFPKFVSVHQYRSYVTAEKLSRSYATRGKLYKERQLEIGRKIYSQKFSTEVIFFAALTFSSFSQHIVTISLLTFERTCYFSSGNAYNNFFFIVNSKNELEWLRELCDPTTPTLKKKLRPKKPLGYFNATAANPIICELISDSAALIAMKCRKMYFSTKVYQAMKEWNARNIGL